MKAAALLFALVVIMWCAIAALKKAHAHDPYSSWRDPRGFSCCDNRDCKPVRADPRPEGWRIWVDGRWMLVPPDAVLKIPSPDGRSHACISPGAQEPRCFVPGEPRS